MIKNLIILFLLTLFTTLQLSTSTYLPSHSFDFRSCTTGQTVTDSIDGEIIASPINGPICGSDGLSFDGDNDYVTLTNWEWGGTTSFEVYVKYDSFNSYSRVFDFGSEPQIGPLIGDAINSPSIESVTVCPVVQDRKSKE